MKRRFNSIKTGIFIVLGFMVMPTLNSCKKNEDNEPDFEVEKIAITPENVNMAVGEQEDFSAYVLTTTGDTLNFDDLAVDSHWWSSDTNVFTVQENGVATGKNEGEAYCIIEATVTLKASQLKALRFYTGRDSAFVSIFH